MKRFSLLFALILALGVLVACGGGAPAPGTDLDPDPTPEPEPEPTLSVEIVAEETSAEQGAIVGFSVNAEGPENIQFEWEVTAGTLVDTDGFFTDSGDEVLLVTPHEEQTIVVTVTATGGTQTETDSIDISVTDEEVEFCADFGNDPNNPCVIYTVEQLQMLAEDDFLAGHFVLGADIDASETTEWHGGAGFEPIGTQNNPFTGRLNGNGHTIDGLVIDREHEDDVGLFGRIKDGEVTSLIFAKLLIVGNGNVGGVAGFAESTLFEDIVMEVELEATANNVGGVAGWYPTSSFKDIKVKVQIDAPDADNIGGVAGGSSSSGGTPEFARIVGEGRVEGKNQVGGLVGDLHYTPVKMSSFTGDVTGEEDVGGIVGKSYGSQSQLSDSFADADVQGNRNVGGLVGFNGNGAGILLSFADGSVEGTQSVGGLVGSHEYGNIIDSYNMAKVRGDNQTGGLVGNYTAQDQSIVNTYSIGKVQVTGAGAGVADSGLVGSTNGKSVVNSYWDTEASGQTGSAADADPLTTEEMADEDNFENWDFGDIWTMPGDGTAPDLQNNSRF